VQAEDPGNVMTRAADLPDAVLRYGNHAEAIIDVHLPPGEPSQPPLRAPLVVLLHGGFWRVEYDRIHTRPLAEALSREGIVVATPEYRRVGGTAELAGGWPTTFEDVSAAMESLPGLLDELDVLPDRVTVMGHSAGGHLALWLANEPHPLDRAIGLAPVADLRAAAAARLGGDAVQGLLGGSPAQLPERYDATDPATRLATRPDCDVVVIHGLLDEIVPVDNARGLDAQHPSVTMCELDGIEHFGLIDPLSPAWPVVLAAVSAQVLPL